MIRLGSYPAYKDSGVEWLGDVPEHWPESKVGADTTLINGFPFDSRYFSRTDGVPLIRIRDLRAKTTSLRYTGSEGLSTFVEPGELIIGMDGDFNTALWRGEKALLNQRMCSLRSLSSSDIRFFAYMLPRALQRINEVTFSTTVKHLSSGQIRRIPYFRPPLDEQRMIADFLGGMDARITRFIAARRKMIALLEEQKQAVINQAVTRGLDPDVPLKDSGVDWLGEIPAHWATKRLKSLVARPLQYGANESGEVYTSSWPRYIRITDVRSDGALRDETKKSLRPETAVPYLLKPGDVLMARSGATVGKSFIYRESWGIAGFAGYLIRARLRTGSIRPDFFKRYTESAIYWAWIGSSSIQATIENVSAEKYANLAVPVPPIREQDWIIEHIDRETSRVDTLIDRHRREIDLIQEYRTRLISDVVTGKLDVRRVELPAVEDVIGEEIEAVMVDRVLIEEIGDDD